MSDRAESAAENYYFKYVPVMPRDQEWGSYVLAVGHAFHPPRKPYPPAVHPDGYQYSWPTKRVLPSYQVLYVARGSGVFESATTRTREVHAGTIIILFPGVWHRYTPDWETGWDDFWVCFDGEVPRKLMESSFFPRRDDVLEVGVHEAIASCFSRIEELLQTEPIGYEKIAASWVTQLLAHVRVTQERRVLRDPLVEQVVRAAKVYMNERVDHPLNVEQLCKNLNVGYSWFRHTFRSVTGIPPKQYHIQLRLDKAQRLLASSSIPVKEISNLLNFDSPYYFSRLFKKKCGMSPAKWRRFSQAQDP